MDEVSDSKLAEPVAVAAEVLPAPPVLGGSLTPDIEFRVHRFYSQVADIFESWVQRSESPHTQRSYRESVMSFVRFLELKWPEEASALLQVSVLDVQRYRTFLVEMNAAGKTINARICAVSSFYRYLGECSSELRLPIVVPNPASAQFVRRASADARDETKDLSLARARHLMSMPSGDGAIAYRDRAILKFYLYTGARIAAGCRLQVQDFHYDDENPTIRLKEKGGKVRVIGLHFAAAEALKDYIEKAQIESGPLFRPRKNSRVEELGAGPMAPYTMWELLTAYLHRLPGATYTRELPNGVMRVECIYTPHSLRATTATVLLESGVDIMEVKELLGHRHVTTTQIYDKRRRATRDSASHKVPF